MFVLQFHQEMVIDPIVMYRVRLQLTKYQFYNELFDWLRLIQVQQIQHFH